MQDRGIPQSEGEPTPVSRLLAAAVIHRGELAAIELGEAGTHAAATAFAAALTWAFLVLAGFAATLAVAASVWAREDRGQILACLALAYAGVCALLARRVYVRLRDWIPFAETRRVFHGDCQAVREMAGKNTG